MIFFTVYNRINLRSMKHIELLIIIFLGFSFNNFALEPKDSTHWKVHKETQRKIDSFSLQFCKPFYCCAEKIDLYSNLIHFENSELPLTANEFHAKMKPLEFAIPMDYNEVVKGQIDYFSNSWQPKLKEVLALKDFYFPIYEEVFDRYNIPLEMKYISVIESALNPKAVSRSGAVGPWQFMSYTGKIFDLSISSMVDERRNIEKSTEAAAQYFARMYDRFGDWLLAIASYNCGPGNVSKAIKKAGGVYDFWVIFPYLPRQTQLYVPNFIAATYLMNYAHEYNIEPAHIIVNQSQVSAVECFENYSLSLLAQELGMTEREILDLNPHLKGNRIPIIGKDVCFKLNLPFSKAMLYYEIKDLIQDGSENNKPTYIETIYTVKRGESLGSISRKYECSIDELMQWNNLNKNFIYPGQKLKILTVNQ